ncbi:hypothetical protein [Tepidibacillus marianensis]|uniref:hypothetical protein n=1 Tax=Tepidibacillus marianensis TaxID=3131995 RepID=UPI0030D51C38
MQLKKIMPTLIVLVVSLLVLFGGNILYQNFHLEQPVEKAVNQIQGIQFKNMSYDRQKVELTINVKQVNNFADTYHQVQDKIQPLVGGRQLQLHFNNSQDQQLLHAWNQAYFDIAQAMDKQEYSIIPKVVEKIKSQSQLKKVGYGMDEKNVYIDLHDKENSLYFVIPRNNNQEVKNLG